VSPRNTAEGATITRENIVAAAVERGSVDGLEGITIGKLATSLRMSKAGVIGHFGNKEALQLAALDQATRTFRAEVWDPVAARPEGIVRLRAVARAWLSHLQGDTFPGGCFLTAASTEFDGRPGPVRDAVESALALWERVLAHDARVATAAGDLPAGTDPRQIAFEMNAVAMGVNQARQLRRDPQAITRGRRAMARVLASD
jgi:AcrR family transcriptional regulator